MIEIVKGGNLPYPGVCVTCGSPNKDCILFDVSQPWNGALIVCVECFRGLAVQFKDRLGLVPLSEVITAKARNAILSARLDNFNEALAELRKSFNDATDRFNRHLDAESGDASSTDGPVARKTIAVIAAD